jgi:hypothetical protein
MFEDYWGSMHIRPFGIKGNLPLKRIEEAGSEMDLPLILV